MLAPSEGRSQATIGRGQHGRVLAAGPEPVGAPSCGAIVPVVEDVGDPKQRAGVTAMQPRLLNGGAVNPASVRTRVFVDCFYAIPWRIKRRLNRRSCSSTRRHEIQIHQATPFMHSPGLVGLRRETRKRDGRVSTRRSRGERVILPRSVAATARGERSRPTTIAPARAETPGGGEGGGERPLAAGSAHRARPATRGGRLRSRPCR